MRVLQVGFANYLSSCASQQLSRKLIVALGTQEDLGVRDRIEDDNIEDNKGGA